MSHPKMLWLPKDQWEAPRVVVGGGELSGKAPLAGLFSGGALAGVGIALPRHIHPLPLPTHSLCAAGFWPSPCLLSDGAGAQPASVLASEPAICSVRSAELAGEVELLDMTVAPGLASPASEVSDRSAQAEMPKVKHVDPRELGNNHGRGTRAVESSPDSDSQQGTGLPGSTNADQEEDQSGSKSTAKSSRDTEFDSPPGSVADQRAQQPSKVETRDR